MTKAYDNDNIFAKMIRGELPSTKVFEDDDVLVVMDIFPQSRGHVLVLPKAGSRNLLDADPATLAAALPQVQRVAKAVEAALQPDGIRIAQFNEEPAGQTVFHLHFHVIPVYENVPLGRGHGEGRADEVELSELARQIASALA